MRAGPKPRANQTGARIEAQTVTRTGAGTGARAGTGTGAPGPEPELEPGPETDKINHCHSRLYGGQHKRVS